MARTQAAPLLPLLAGSCSKDDYEVLGMTHAEGASMKGLPGVVLEMRLSSALV